MTQKPPIVVAHRAGSPLTANDVTHPEWQKAMPVMLARYWSGTFAPVSRQAEARLLWTPDALLVRFVCAQSESLVVRDAPDTSRKVMGLWDYDVCEIFVAPDAERVEHYYEFEVAPTGEWLDVEINWERGERKSVWEYASGMKTAARIEEKRVTILLWLPWAAFGRTPQPGEEWRGNLFRCVGPLGAERGYLAWHPTRAPQPDFHVPTAFGSFIFAG